MEQIKLGSGLGGGISPLPPIKIPFPKPLIPSYPKITSSPLNFPGKLPSSPAKYLNIRDFPNSGFQLHIHDGKKGKGHIVDYDRNKFNLSSYESAMGDLYADLLGIKKISREE